MSFLMLFGVVLRKVWKWLFCRPSCKLSFPGISFLLGACAGGCGGWNTVVSFSFLRRWKLSRWARGSCHLHCSDGWLPSREGCPASWSARPWVCNFPGILQIWHQVQGRLLLDLYTASLNQVCKIWHPAHFSEEWELPLCQLLKNILKQMFSMSWNWQGGEQQIPAGELWLN